jgi:hypothetical protein
VDIDNKADRQGDLVIYDLDMSALKPMIPPPPAKHILSSYTMSNPISKRAISDYVETQAHDEAVQYPERIISVHTDNLR